MFMVQT
jgi:hypothetical protein